MKLKTPLLGVAAAAIALSTATVAVSPAQAAIVAGSALNLASPIGGGVSATNSKIDFSGTIPLVQNVAVTGGANSFSISPLGLFVSNFINIAQIKDVPLSSGVFTGSLAGFISGITTTGFGSANAVSFDLTKFVFNNTTKAGDFFGVIRKGTDFSDAIGQFTTQTLNGATSYSMTVTAVPTPALLPGLIGLGMGMLRKRKKEMAAVSAEA